RFNASSLQRFNDPSAAQRNLRRAVRKRDCALDDIAHHEQTDISAEIFARRYHRGRTTLRLRSHLPAVRLPDYATCSLSKNCARRGGHDAVTELPYRVAHANGDLSTRSSVFRLRRR